MGKHPPEEVALAFADVDLILHAGDIYSSACLDWLEQIAPILAVEVPPAPCVGDPRVARKRVVEIGGRLVGLVHDLIIMNHGFEVAPGVMERQVGADEPLDDYLYQFFGEHVERHQGILFVNPGSPTLPRQTRGLGTVGIMDTDDNGHEARIVQLPDYRE